jgi:hypothetical protein
MRCLLFFYYRQMLEDISKMSLTFFAGGVGELEGGIRYRRNVA